MEREVIEIDIHQWYNLVEAGEIFTTSGIINFVEVEDSVEFESNYKIFKRISDGKFFRVNYNIDFCSEDNNNEIHDNGKYRIYPENLNVTEVFEEKVVITKYV